MTLFIPYFSVTMSERRDIATAEGNKRRSQKEHIKKAKDAVLMHIVPKLAGLFIPENDDRCIKTIYSALDELCVKEKIGHEEAKRKIAKKIEDIEYCEENTNEGDLRTCDRCQCLPNPMYKQMYYVEASSLSGAIMKSVFCQRCMIEVIGDSIINDSNIKIEKVTKLIV